MTAFKNPENGNIETITRKDFYWCLLFGFFIFYKKKNMVSCNSKFPFSITNLWA